VRNRSLYLLDTSAWLAFLPTRAPPTPLRERIESLRNGDQVAITGMVRLELLAAISNEQEHHRRAALLDALPLLLTTEQRWSEAAWLGSQLRAQGLTIPNTDLLIAAVAMAEGATVLHQDRHFDLIAQHHGLLVESHLPGC
jgi:predicted nucleic acid-binding protein